MQRPNWARLPAFAMMIALSLPLQAGAATGCTRPANADRMTRDLVAWVNSARKSFRLGPVKADPELSQAAQAQACDMVERNYFDHSGPGGPDLTARLRHAGYDYQAAAENIAIAGPDEVANVWRASAPHWANILAPGMTDIGIGIAAPRPGQNPQPRWVMDLGQRF